MSRIQSLFDYIFTKYGGATAPCERDCGGCKRECHQCCRAQYFGDLKICYACEPIKRAYLNKFLASRVVQNRAPLQVLIRKLENDTISSVLSVGGGPGTEYIALADCLLDHDLPLPTGFDCFDVERSWEPYFQDLTAQFSKSCAPATGSICRFFAGDARSAFGTHRSYDVVFVPWILSEIDMPAEREAVLRNAAARSRKWMIVTERTQGDVAREIDDVLKRVFKSPGLSQTAGNNGVSFPEPIKKLFIPAHGYETAYWVIKVV